MRTAPIELVLVRFPENRFRGEITEALGRLVQENVIRIIDLLVVSKDKHGNVTIAEASELEDEEYQALVPILSETKGILNSEDARELSKEMKNDSSAGLMLFEDTWAKDLTEAIDRAGGEVMVNERIPRASLEEEKVAA